MNKRALLLVILFALTIAVPTALASGWVCATVDCPVYATPGGARVGTVRAGDYLVVAGGEVIGEDGIAYRCVGYQGSLCYAPSDALTDL